MTAERLRARQRLRFLPPELEELPLYFLAECERDLGHLEASLTGMRQVADRGGRLAPDANRGLIHLARRVGRFPDALAAAERLGTAGRHSRTLGELWWTQGNIPVACDAFAAARDEALSQGHKGEAALSQAYLAFAASFQDRARAAEQISYAERLLEGTQARFAELQVRIAQLLQQAGHADDLPEQAETVVAATHDNGLTSSVAYTRFAVCFHAAIRQDRDLIDISRARLAECVHGAEFAYLLELTYLMLDEEPPADLPRAQWIEGVQATARRWADLVADRRHPQALGD